MDICSERQVVYILVEIRKAIEQSGEQQKYFALDFYCSFALHTRMSRAGAKRILARFDRAYPILCRGEELPRLLEKELEETTKLDKFCDEMELFLDANRLPTHLAVQADRWAKFLHSYADVIDDCALVIRDDTTLLQHIDHVSVHLDKPEKPLETEYGTEELFRIRWVTHGKDAKTGSHSVYFSYSDERLRR